MRKTSIPWSGVRGGLCVLAVGIACLCFAGVASAQDEFCFEGEGAGQCIEPLGVGVDQDSGDVFVLDGGNSRINRFDEDGNFELSFGWGVKDGVTGALQTCGPAATPPSACFKGLKGSGPGQINAGSSRASLSVGENGEVYVVTNAQVQAFDGDGALLRIWGWDVVSNGAGDSDANGLPDDDQFEVCVPADGDICKPGVALDLPGSDPEHPTPLSATGPGQISGGFQRLALGPDDEVYLLSGSNYVIGNPPQSFQEALVQRFTADGEYIGRFTVEDTDVLVYGLGVDSDGDAYVSVQASEGIRKYTAEGTFLRYVGARSRDFVVDPRTNTLYASNKEPSLPLNSFSMFDASGDEITEVLRFGIARAVAGEPRLSYTYYRGMASAKSGAGIFASFGGQGGLSDRVALIPFPPPGPVIPGQGTVSAPGVGSVRATLRALIDPEGKLTTYHFEYVTESAYLADKAGGGDGFGSAATVVTPPEQMEEEDFSLHYVETTIGCPDPVSEASEEGKCLDPETRYRFRVVAEHQNGDEGEGPVEGEPFETRSSVEHGDAWSTDVGAESAKLHATVNPLGVPTQGWFEYVDAVSCQEDVDASGPGHCFDRARRVPDTSSGAEPLDVGSAEAMTQVSAIAIGLNPGTAYHYRLVVENPLIEPLGGQVRDLHTFALPVGGEDSCANRAFRTGISAKLADCRAYEMVSPVDKDNGAIVNMRNTFNFPVAYNQSAVAGGKLAYSSVRAFGDAQSSPFVSQYIATRDAAGQEWTSSGISPPRGVNVLGQSFTLDNEFLFFSEDLCQGWLRHDTDPPKAPGAVPGYANIYKRYNCGAQAGSYEAVTTSVPTGAQPNLYKPELQGVSANGEHAVYRVNMPLTDGAKPGVFNVYDSAEGDQRLVCISPNGSSTSVGCSLGGNSRGAVGEDHRQRTVTHAVSDDGSRIFWSVGALADSDTRDLYVRVNGHNAGNECANPVRPCTVSVGNGQYWQAATDGSAVLFTTEDGDLRRFDVDARTTDSIAPEVVGVMGASDDLSRIYFISRASLAEDAEAGKPNLYFHEDREDGDRLSYIGALTEAETSLAKSPSPITLSPVLRTSRVTSDGLHAAFMSAARLTDYDNADAETGEAAAEVFRYAADSDELDCISCNPTGARPQGARLQISNAENGIWAAAVLPGPYNQLYAPQVISRDGARVYFETGESLVLADTNGVQDVYQWEAAGSGDCAASSEAFSDSAGGCVSLISSGRGATTAEFVDASADGTDVFFTTGASLLPQDPGLIDIYDARAGGGFPAPPAPTPVCEGEACQGPIAAPNDPTPASAVFQGAGNVVEEKARAKKKARRCPKGKHRVKRRGKVRCQKKHKAKRKHHRKAKHNRRAGR